jgi:hypothetical protein
MATNSQRIKRAIEGLNQKLKEAGFVSIKVI